MQDFLIDSMGAKGDGVAAGPLYAALTLPGERVRAERQGDRAEVEAILEPSPDRVAPPCPYFGDCGGCALQHWAQLPYLAWKADQLRQALARERIETEILPTFVAPAHSRRRLALHARAAGKGVALGFKARRSWRLVEIGSCTIAHPRLEAAFPALTTLAKPFLEHPKSAPTLHVTLTETGLDVDVTGIERRSGGLSADARVQAAERAAAGDFARVTLAGEIVYQARQPLVRLGRVVVGLPPGGFLQAVPEAEAAMAAFAVQAIAGASRVADLFCGVGTFSVRLAEVASVTAADVSAASIKALIAASGAPGLKAISAEARDLARRPMLAAEMKRLDAVLFDPPRAGAAEQAREIAASKVPVAIGVSCDPATFARDARILADGGFTLRRVLPVDQFLWSPHVELIGVFTR
jgi:23S rRNA (uracil1939-C5)-methyltransferase